jgi:hypothetical protein
VQVDPVKPKLKPPGTEILKLTCDILLSTSAIRFILRRYSKVHAALDAREKQMASMRLRVSQCLLLLSSSTAVKALRNDYSTIRANS